MLFKDLPRGIVLYINYCTFGEKGICRWLKDVQLKFIFLDASNSSGILSLHVWRFWFSDRNSNLDISAIRKTILLVESAVDLVELDSE